jgi:hypothetical protein
VSDHETSTLTARLTSLADELAPSADPGAQVRGARARYRRQRRNRIAAVGVVAAAAILAVGVPTAIGALSSAPDRGEVAGPGEAVPSETTGGGTAPGTTQGPPQGREDAQKVDRWTETLDQRAERDARLSSVADGLRAALQARPAPLSLTAPEVFGRCPDWAPALSSSLGVPLEPQDGPAGSGPFCLWSGFPENEDVVVQLEYATGSTREQMYEDVTIEAAEHDCYPTALPGVAVAHGLLLCDEDGRTSWGLRFLDTDESVVWSLTVNISDRHPGDDVQAVMAAVELLDTTW